jgi:hypothetical protein
VLILAENTRLPSSRRATCGQGMQLPRMVLRHHARTVPHDTRPVPAWRSLQHMVLHAA